MGDMSLNDVAAPNEAPQVFAFGDFRLDTARVELTLRGRPLALRPKVYALLRCFVAHPGRTLGKAELMAALWSDVVVTDDSLVQCVTDLRAVLGADGSRFVVTVPRHGYRFDATVGPGQEPVPPSAAGAAAAPPRPRERRVRSLAWVVAGIALPTIAGAWALHALQPRPDRLDLAIDRERSVAVLPLVWQGASASPELAEAMTEELIGDIARVPGTRVIARASAAAAAARDPDPRQIGKLLDVSYIVTGTLAERSQDAPIPEFSVQLASADTGAVLWSERWRAPSDGDAAWRTEVPLRVARALDLRLTATVHRQGASAALPEAVAALALGDHLLRNSTAPADVRKAHAAYQRALAADPRSARAWTGLALSDLSAVQGRWAEDPAARTASAAGAIAEALALDPEFPLAHYAQGHLRMVRGDPAGALAAYQRVLALNPSDAWAHARVGAALLALGRFGDVAASVERARRLSPLESTQVAFGHVIAGAAAFHLGHDQEAYDDSLAATRHNPANATAWALIAAIDALHDRADGAAHAIAQLKAIRPAATVAAFRQANAANLAPLRAGDERLYAGLLKAGLSP